MIVVPPATRSQEEIARQLGLTQVLRAVAGDDDQDVAPGDRPPARVQTGGIQRSRREIGQAFGQARAQPGAGGRQSRSAALRPVGRATRRSSELAM
jgi:hypothetical protein